VEVVVTEEHDIELVRVVPPFDQARCVIGLDAYPTPERWQWNTTDEISVSPLLTDDERRNWRILERGQLVVQTGDSVHAFTNSTPTMDKLEALLRELRRRESVPPIHTALTTKFAKEEVERLFDGKDSSETILHYGKQWSRNVFSEEQAGILIGCLSLNDRKILSRLALLSSPAELVRSDKACSQCNGDGCAKCVNTGDRRETPREFTGSEPEVARRILASVREKHVVEGIGRYARQPEQSEEFTTVFVWTSAIPDDLVDIELPDVRELSEKREKIVEYVAQSEDPVSTSEISDAVNAGRETARQCLSELEELGHATLTKDGRTHLYDLDEAVYGVLPAW
jgi:predicted transcriptional regulator